MKLRLVLTSVVCFALFCGCTRNNATVSADAQAVSKDKAAIAAATTQPTSQAMLPALNAKLASDEQTLIDDTASAQSQQVNQGAAIAQIVAAYAPSPFNQLLSALLPLGVAGILAWVNRNNSNNHASVVQTMTTALQQSTPAIVQALPASAQPVAEEVAAAINDVASTVTKPPTT